VIVRDTATEDPAEDGIVVSQNPAPGAEAEPGSTVTIFVGRLETVEPPPPPVEPPPPPPPPPQQPPPP
jgi:beta-lactam-binding protein with PASTA domain